MGLQFKLATGIMGRKRSENTDSATHKMTVHHREWVGILALFVCTRLVLIGIGITAMTSLPSVTGSEYRHLQTTPAVDMWYRWDAGFYLAIARYGYSWVAKRQITPDMVFLPL